MIFDGFPIWFVTSLVFAGACAVAASYFLKMRRKTVVVPTTLFWMQAFESRKRNILFGRFTPVWSMLFLSVIMSAIAFSMLNPVFGPIKKTVIVIDRSPATDLELARKYLKLLIGQSDKCSIIAAGDEITVFTNFECEKSTSLAAVDLILSSKSPFSGIKQAIREARSMDNDAEVIVLTGQDIPEKHNVQVIMCAAANHSPDNNSLKVCFPDELAVFAEAYCRADERFQFCRDPVNADLVLKGSGHNNFTDWKRPEFIESFSDYIESGSGLKYRQAVGRAQVIQNEVKPALSHRFPFYKLLIAGIMMLLIIEIYLCEKGVII